MFPSVLSRPLKLAWLTDDIVIGSAPSGADWRSLVRQGINAVLEIRSEASDDKARLARFGIEHLRVPAVQGAAPTIDQLQLTVDWVLERISHGRKVFIHCGRDMGRSATVACATLIALGFPLDVAYQLLKRAQPYATLSTSQSHALYAFASIKAAQIGSAN